MAACHNRTALGFWLRFLIDCILRGVVSVKHASSDLNFFSSTAAADGPQPVAPIEANCRRGWKSDDVAGAAAGQPVAIDPSSSWVTP